jgi:hypothetical protein
MAYDSVVQENIHALCKCIGDHESVCSATFSAVYERPKVSVNLTDKALWVKAQMRE